MKAATLQCLIEITSVAVSCILFHHIHAKSSNVTFKRSSLFLTKSAAQDQNTNLKVSLWFDPEKAFFWQ